MGSIHVQGGMVWAEEAASSDPAWMFFAQAGLAGILLLFFLRWAYAVHKKQGADLDACLQREREATKAAHERERQQTKDLIDKYLPTMQEVTRVLADVLLILRDSEREQRRR